MNLTVDSYVNDGSLDISVYYEEAEADAVRTLYVIVAFQMLFLFSLCCKLPFISCDITI